jgi:hypothetical protein
MIVVVQATGIEELLKQMFDELPQASRERYASRVAAARDVLSHPVADDGASNRYVVCTIGPDCTDKPSVAL